jgi:S-layer protein (TIGR01567 family)
VIGNKNQSPTFIVLTTSNAKEGVVNLKYFKLIAVALVVLCVFLPGISPCSADTLEIRGTTYDTGSVEADSLSWDFRTFDGFIYGIRAPYGYVTTVIPERLYYTDKGGSPALGKSNPTSHTFDEGELIYYTQPIDTPYEVFDNEIGVTKIDFAPFFYMFGKVYIAAGYDATNLATMVFAQGPDDRKTLKVGETWEWPEGYSLTLNDVDIEGNTCHFSLCKDGEVLESGIVDTGTGDINDKIYTANADVGSSSDVIYFVIFVDSVFQGSTEKFANFKYAFLIDQYQPFSIDEDYEYGVFEVDSAASEGITMSNKKGIKFAVDRDVKCYLTDEWYFRISDMGKGTNGGYVIYPAMEVTLGEENGLSEDTGAEEPVAKEIESEELIVINMSEVDALETEESIPGDTIVEENGEEAKNAKSSSMPGFGMPLAVLSILSIVLLFGRKLS